jgi:Zn-dependent protease
VLNLLPILPLDGGHLMRRLLMWFGGGTGYAWASIVSVVSAGVVAVLAWRMSQPPLAMFMAYLALKEWQASL